MEIKVLLDLIDPLTSYFGNTWIVFPLFIISVFITVLLIWPIIFKYMIAKSNKSKKELERLFDLIYVEVEDRKLRITLFLLSYGLGFVVFLVCWPNIILGLVLSIGVTFLGIKFPVIYIQGMYEKRCNKVVDNMIDGMTVMANGIKAGLSITQSMERVVENIKGPLAQEFKVALNKIRLGLTVEEALSEMADRVPRQDIQMFVTAVNILKETGGNLSETFETINMVVRERQKVEKKIEAMTAQGIMQGVIISAMPFFLLGIFQVLDPEFVKPLFSTTAGLIALMLIFVLVIIGGVIIKKIVTIKV